MPEGTIYNNQERVDQVVNVLRDALTTQSLVVKQNLLDQGFSEEQADVELTVEVPVEYILGIIPPAIEMLRVSGISSNLLTGSEQTISPELRVIGVQTQAVLQAVAQALSQTYEDEADVLAFGERLEGAGAKVTIDVVDEEEQE